MPTTHKKPPLMMLASLFIFEIKSEATISHFGFISPEATARLISKTTIIPPILPGNWTLLPFLLLLIILIFMIIRLSLCSRRSRILNEKMVHYIQTVHHLQKTIELMKGPLEEISQDKNISEAHKSKLYVAIWSASTIQKTLLDLMELEESDKSFQCILHSSESKDAHFKEKIASRIITYNQLKEILLEADRDNPINQELLTDQLFIEKLMMTLNNNMENTDFTVDVLCDKIGMSRSSLYHKIKDISGQAPADFIRQYRLERAKELLTTHQYTISEVAYKTGFSDVKYFRTIFKKKYKTNPGNFAKTQ
ncbi:MAG: helix-turn-helix transcriptional regulator [Bacteroidales bacterium]|nr:helix-turn-helix transcriptional regulator [Bacteroidales bacterium]